MEQQKVKFAFAGLGNRGSVYTACVERYGDDMEIAAIADPDEEKLARARDRYCVPEDKCFATAEEMLQQEKLADVFCIATLDRQHYKQAIAAMRKGYHLLLEKPISPDAAECKEIAKVAAEENRQVVVCHVLRYTPFYSKLKELLDSGVIGDVVAIQALEQVCYWHQAHSFVRGNWRNSNTTSPMILQKSCHDMDILLWLAGKSCKRVTSYGSLTHFLHENKPEGAASRCTEDCKVKDTCPFNAVKFYVGHVEKGELGWPMDVVLPDATPETMLETLKTSPYGRCVYDCDNNVVDHQVVMMELEDGITVDFTMCGMTADGGRRVHIMGTKGDIDAGMEENYIIIKEFGKEPVHIDVRDLAEDFSGHGGGDVRMVKDLIDLLLGRKEEKNALTSVDKSVESHYVALAAEQSRCNNGRTVDMAQFVAELKE